MAGGRRAGPFRAASSVARRWRGLGAGFRFRGWRDDERIVWMLGSPRSGSTWLMGMLAEHPAVAPLDEPLIGWYLGPFLSDAPGFDPTALSAADFTIRRIEAGRRDHFFADEFADVWTPALGRLIRDRFRAQLRGYPPQVGSSRSRLVVKEPNGSQSADLISRALPRSRLLFLLRDGRDVVDSELAGLLPGGWATRHYPGARGIGDDERLAFLVQSACKWLWRTEVVEAALAAHPGSTHRVRYEDLVRDPQPRLAELFRWLDLEARPEELGAWVRSHEFEAIDEPRGEGEFHRLAAPGAWRQSLTDDEQRAVEAVIGPKLRQLGYELEEEEVPPNGAPAGGAAPAPPGGAGA